MDHHDFLQGSLKEQKIPQTQFDQWHSTRLHVSNPMQSPLGNLYKTLKTRHTLNVNEKHEELMCIKYIVRLA